MARGRRRCAEKGEGGEDGSEGRGQVRWRRARVAKDGEGSDEGR
jgi:hypothetical protein